MELTHPLPRGFPSTPPAARVCARAQGHSQRATMPPARTLVGAARMEVPLPAGWSWKRFASNDLLTTMRKHQDPRPGNMRTILVALVALSMVSVLPAVALGHHEGPVPKCLERLPADCEPQDLFQV